MKKDNWTIEDRFDDIDDAIKDLETKTAALIIVANIDDDYEKGKVRKCKKLTWKENCRVGFQYTLLAAILLAIGFGIGLIF